MEKEKQNLYDKLSELTKYLFSRAKEEGLIKNEKNN